MILPSLLHQGARPLEEAFMGRNKCRPIERHCFLFIFSTSQRQYQLFIYCKKSAKKYFFDPMNIFRSRVAFLKPR
jgi:hypothetical protein